MNPQHDSSTASVAPSRIDRRKFKFGCRIRFPMGEKQSGALARFTYVHERRESSTRRSLDAHHVEVRTTGGRTAAAFLFTALVTANAAYVFLYQERTNVLPFWGFLLAALLIMKICWKTVKKESVLIMPSFGVQLETHYRGGRIIRGFVPIGKILKPVLQECFTPVTCYGCLSLLLRDEEHLMLVFKEVRPPLRILVPIWKALCAVADENYVHSL